MRQFVTRRLWPALVRSVERWNADDGFTMSAAMAFYAAVALFPLVLVLIAGLGIVLRFWPVAQNAQDQLLDFISDNTTPWLAGQLQQVLAGVESQAGVGGPVGAVSLVVTATVIFVHLENMFDRIWGIVPPPDGGVWHTVRRVLVGRATAFVMLLCLGLLLIVYLATDVTLAWLRRNTPPTAAGQYGWRFVPLVVSILFKTAIFALLFKVVPKTRVAWRHAFGGALLTAGIWEIGEQALSLLVIGEKYSAYGVIGAFMAVMLWIYYASAILFLGAEFVRALSLPRPIHPRNQARLVAERPSAALVSHDPALS